MKTFYLGLILAFVLLTFQLHAETNPLQLTIDKESFKLLQEGKEYYLKLPTGEKIPLQKKWLFPPDQIEKDADSYVTSFNYDPEVHSFSIGEDFMGLHISSYAIQESGSAMAAAGRDVFLVFDTMRKKLNQGGINLGITKERVRSMGCFWAKFNNFFIGDINDDGFTDLGVVMERIWCEEYFDEIQQVDSISGPFYQKQRIEWYIFQSTKWMYQSEFDGMKPKNTLIRLSLIRLSKSPVKFVRDILGDRIIER